MFQTAEDPKPPVNQNGKVPTPTETTNGTTIVPVNGSKRKSEPDINVIPEEDEDAPPIDDASDVPLQKVDNKKDKQKRISFRGEKIITLKY